MPDSSVYIMGDESPLQQGVGYSYVDDGWTCAEVVTATEPGVDWASVGITVLGVGTLLFSALFLVLLIASLFIPPAKRADW